MNEIRKPAPKPDNQALRVRTQLENRYGPQKAEFYTKFMGESFLPEDSQNALLTRMLRGEQEIDTTVVAQLRALSDEAQDNPPNPFVHQARRELREYFSSSRLEMPVSHANYIRGYGVSIILYGSLQYGDPRNLDVDLSYVGDVPAPDADILDNFVLNSLTTDLNRYWDNLSHFEGRMRGGSDIGIVHYLSEFQHLPELLETDEEGASLHTLSKVISGVPLFPEDAPRIAALRRQATEISESDPLLCAITNEDLASTLQIRLDRRQR